MSTLRDRRSAPRRSIGDIEFDRTGAMKVLAYVAVVFLSLTFWGAVACVIWAAA